MQGVGDFPSVPVLLLCALLAMALAVGTGAWRGTAMAGGSAPKAAPMQAQDGDATARQQPPAPAEVRGAVDGTGKTQEARQASGEPPRQDARAEVVTTGPDKGDAGGDAGDGAAGHAAGPGDVPNGAVGAVGSERPDRDGVDKTAGEVAGKGAVGVPDAPLVAQAEQPGQARQPGQSGQPGQPAAEATPAPKGSTGIRLFKTIEFRGPLKNLPKWDRVLGVDRKNPGLIPERALGGRNALWGELRSEWRGLSTMDKLRNVNSLFNQWPYRLDSEVWGVVDYWAAPVEFLRKSGDCEDYAITKYFALKQLGVPVSDMRIVILLDSIRRLAHAILVVYTGGDAYVLDNLSNVVLSHQRYGHYVPQYSINEEHRWAHIPVRGGPGTRRMQ
ncbi:transglutaminase-like cysteine peptidase [Nitratidesulfovibrio sp. HK-II]|uniref:transglutaminase-like cysteine peptidase n=1 Tax=Nitratidesulfovibrio sp. HK-II TaxID=2009266 RepID=UPI000E2ED8FD|nr:transglutaminase-like cysteine peptidase [Nitratidesulfovibrio sp. HK-II]GBO95195.1 predicted periplasmic protein [Nitratidesulfovibrio sp. HK-II]